MRLIGFRSFDWTGSGFRAGIPKDAKPYLSVNANVIPRAGSTPTFGPSQVSERIIPCEFTYNGGELSYEDAWNELLVRLNVYDTRPGELRAERNDGTLVAIYAILTMPNAGSFFGIDDVTSLPVLFVSVEPFWRSLTETTESKTFTDELDQAFSVPIISAIADAPTLVIQPTVQRASATTTVGWKKRRTYRITNGTSRPLVNKLVAIDFGASNTIVAAGDALASGNDLRVVRDGKEVARNLAGWNTADTLVWIVIPSLAAGSSADYDLWYDNASAGSPTTLTGASKPAIDTATSTQAVKVYPVDRVAADAGLGGWSLSSGTVVPVVSTDVPEAWRWVTTKESPDDMLQEQYTDYVDTNTYYHGVFSARRARAASLVAEAQDTRADGVMLYEPSGITNVRFDLEWINDYAVGESGDPVGRVVLLSSQDGQNWQIVEQWNTVQETITQEAVDDYAITGDPPYVALAVWPYSGERIPTTVVAGRRVTGAWYSTLEVTTNDDALITQSLTQAEEEIYELATEVRIGGDTDLDAPYRAIRVGGATTRRLAVRLDENVVIDLGDRRAEVWNDGRTEKVADVPVFSVQAVQKLSASASESAASTWLDMEPYINPLANDSFAVDLTGWSRKATAAGVTAAAQARDTTVFKTTPASLKSEITASTALSGVDAVQEIAADYLPIAGKTRVVVAGEQRTDNANLQPSLTVWFYDAEQNELSSSVADDWSPVADTWYRRVHSAAVPSGAAYFRVGTTARPKLANQTGSNWLDDIAPNGLDLIVQDTEIGTIVVTVGWLAQYL